MIMTPLEKSEMQLQRLKDLIANTEHSHSVLCLKLEPISIMYMTKENRFQLTKLIEIYMADCDLLLSYSNL